MLEVLMTTFCPVWWTNISTDDCIAIGIPFVLHYSPICLHTLMVQTSFKNFSGIKIEN